MSSAKGANHHHHSASFTYGAIDGPLASGVSQERSTASPSQPTALSSQQQQYSWGARPLLSTVPSPQPNHSSFVLPPMLPQLQLQINAETLSQHLNRASISSPSAHVQIQPYSNSHPQGAGTMQQPSHYSPTQSLPQVQPHYSSNPAPNMMLPPLRMPNDPRTHSPYQSSAPPAPSPYGFSSYPAMPSYVPQGRPQSYPYGGHVTQHSTSSSVGSELWTPVSANGGGGYPFQSHQPFSGASSHTQQPPTPSTIQPSVFPSWQSVSESRGRSTQGTISPLGVLGSDSKGADNRRSSTPGQSAGERWDRPSQSGIALSPDTSDHLSSEDEVKPDIKVGNVTYTTDAETKQTPELKRMCFNCTNKSPPSWRKSVLHPGKILCNKCGIFERTHHRPRPPQNDDQKLRKQTQLVGATYRRELPPALQVMKDESDGSPQSQPHSPYSNVPAHATPISATFPVTSHYSPSDGLMTSSALPHRRTGLHLHQQTSPSQHSLATPVSSSSDMDVSPSRGWHGQGHGTSPYAHAYANRRTYSQPMRMTSPIMPISAGIPNHNQTQNQNQNQNQNTNHGAGPMPLGHSIGWNTGRRHSDAQLHSGLLSASSSAASLGQSSPNDPNAHDGDDDPNANGGVGVRSDQS